MHESHHSALSACTIFIAPPPIVMFLEQVYIKPLFISQNGRLPQILTHRTWQVETTLSFYNGRWREHP